MTTQPIWVPGNEVREFGPDNTYRWATITDTSPLRVRLDGDSDGLPVTPDSLVSSSLLVEGDRVWVQMYGRRLIILGRGSGVLDDTGWVSVPITNTTVYYPYANADEAIPQVRRIGKQIYFRGALGVVVTTADIDSSSTTTANKFTNIPVGFRPPPGWADPPFVQQGSSDNRWALRVYANGDAHAHRYGPGTSAAGSWLPFSAQWTED